MRLISLGWRRLVILTWGSFSESAATLEAESGYSLESHQVTAFRRCILDGLWDQADDALLLLGVTDEDNLLVSCV